MFTNQIKFKGKSAVNGKWIYGYYVKKDGCNYIHNDNGVFGVHPPSVAMYSGKKDSAGNEIYNNDILSGNFVTSCGINSKSKKMNFKVIFMDGKFTSGINGMNLGIYRYLPHFDKCDILGTLFENPELLDTVQK